MKESENNQQESSRPRLITHIIVVLSYKNMTQQNGKSGSNWMD